MMRGKDYGKVKLFQCSCGHLIFVLNFKHCDPVFLLFLTVDLSEL